MKQNDLINKYIKHVGLIRKRARKLNLNDNEIDKIFNECFNHLETKESTSYKTALKICFITLVISLFGYVLLNVHQPTSSIVLRNVQGLIYPGLKFVRFLSIPIISFLPSLTGLYDETCLIENPFFYVHNMECWPCENVVSVLNISDQKSSLRESGSPYIIKHNQQKVALNDLINLYKNNKNIFDINANILKSSNSSINTLTDLLTFTPNQSSNAHISWRINRMLPARILRQLFPRPCIMTEWSGQSIERFVLIDEAKAEAYTLPAFECSNVFLIQVAGKRSIILKPTRECGQKCKTLSVVLTDSYLLSYNWWYWRPLSLPVENSTNLSISYISSYC